MNLLRRPFILGSALVFIGISLLASCGGGSSGTTNNTPGTPSTPTTPTNPTAPTPPEPGIAASEFADLIQDMDLNDILDMAWPVLSLRDPESVLGLGLAEQYQLDTLALTPIDFPYQVTTIAMWQALYERLQLIDRASLDTAQQVNYDSLLWLAQRNAEMRGFIYFDYQATYFLTGVPSGTQLFFSDLHPLQTESDVQDYLTRLTFVDDKFTQLINNLQEMEAYGVIEPQFTLDVSINVHSNAVSNIDASAYFANFSSKLDDISSLTDTQKASFRDTARATIRDEIVPAYNQLVSFLQAQRNRAPQQIGVGQFPGGEAYYQQRLRYHTTTNLTALEIHELGLQEIARIHSELRERFDQLGYSAGESLQQLFSRVANDGGFIATGQIISTYERLISDAEDRMMPLFNRFPVQQVRVVGGPTGGFYVRGSLDGSRDGAFFAQNVSPEAYFIMPTLAYHEAMPGHHMQIALAQETALPDFRRNYPATGYIEGWGLYAERLAGDYNWYANDIYGDIGRLNFEALRAARLVVDTGIHAFGWSQSRAVSWFEENVGVSNNSALGNIARYSIYTGQATAYMTGMLKILELRERMREAQGDNFDIRDFHDLVLDNGALPLTVLEAQIDLAIAND
ncbi:DUF885 domain-containing protein [Planctobacterium marinum]|uniref:DUF885 domain-containing protein n=1 Tax=Planctobacterium marinum TaxID=1631968 RepID=A0AA48HLI9_9ALTE|nr:hypothetical protein MACH26_41970 [Planctobacterium marinum]